MDVLCHYSEKENLQAGRPVVKGSDIDRVKRNLTSMPLKPRTNQLDNNNQSSTPLFLRKCVNSPITELANTFTELAAHETTGTGSHNTPKRRLSLTSSLGSPTPDFDRLKSLTASSQTSNTPSSPTSSITSTGTDSESFSSILKATRKVVDQRFEVGAAPKQSSRRPRKLRLGGVSAFRRYNSSPFGYHTTEASPQLGGCLTGGLKSRLISPLAHGNSKPFFQVGEDSDSGFGKDVEFQFITPSIPPEKAQAQNEQSPAKSSVCKRADVIGSPDIYDTRAQDSVDSPLLAHQLCSLDDDAVDEGYVDYDDLEKQECGGDVPDPIANMLTGKMLVGTQSSPADEVDNLRGNLFKSPSMPNRLNKPGKAFDIRRRVFCKRPDPPRDNNTPVAANKKRRSVLSDGNMPPVPLKVDTLNCPASMARIQRCKSMVEHSATYEMNKSDADSSALTGDFSKTCCLPLINGKHGDLRSISSETMARILNKEFDDKLFEYTIVDCRYPYEYDGGHIKGAENIYTKEALYAKYLSSSRDQSMARCDEKRSILIFHCEFSSERAPRLSRFLRNHDRELNKDHYPNLYYPEVYLLEGGYKAFYESYKELCVPHTYKPMLHKDHSEDLKTFRAKSKSWAGVDRKAAAARPGLMRRL